MKKIVLGIIIITAMAGCNNQPEKTVEKETKPMPVVKDSIADKFAGLAFDSKKDLSCGMPISAGLNDTAHYKGKLYGFCSAECKADFLKNAETLLKAK